MILVNDDIHPIEVYEFQGEFQSLEKYNGVFDRTKLTMDFDNFTLQGRKVKKDLTIFEVIEGKEVKTLSYVEEVILFDKPPRFKMIKRL